MTFPTRKVAMAANVSTGFALRGIVSRSTVALEFEKSRAAIHSRSCFNRISMGFPNQKRSVRHEGQTFTSSLLDNVLYSMELFRNGGMS